MLSTLFTNDVRQTLDQFRRSVDQMFDNFYGQALPSGSTASGDRTWTFSPVVETGWNDQYLNLRAILPGVAEKDAVLLALEKGRAGQDAPTFAVRITYVQSINAWDEKGPARLTLPALDLPISRTGVELYHSPRFRVALQPGAFRAESDPGVFAEALRRAEEADRISGNIAGGAFAQQSVAARMSPPPPAAPMEAPAPIQRESQVRQLIDRYRNEGGGRAIAGTLPVDVTFPAIGPSLFMAAELTAESAAPSIDLAIRRIK